MRTSFGAWYALAVLTVVTLFAVVDRQVLVLQAETIRKALQISDAQLGLMQGTGVALFAALASYPLSWFADRYDRRLVLAGCLVVWSTAVVACGMAQTYEAMLFASAMVGAGEAGLVPIVYALIPALFHDKSRQTANSIYALATGTGGALAMIVGGQLIAASGALRASLPGSLNGLEEWRISFLAAAAPAPIMILLIATIVLRPGQAKQAVAATETSPDHAAPSKVSLLAYYRDHPFTFAGFYFGIALQAMGFGAVTSWLVVICMRQFGETPAQVGAGVGMGSLISLPLGFLASIVISRVFSQRVGVVLPIRATRIAFMVSTLLLASLALATTALHVYVIAFLIMLTLISGSMFLPTAVQSLAPSHLRARVIAVQLVISSIFAAVSPPVVGLLSDQYKTVPNGLLLSALAIGVPCLVATVLAFYLCELGFERTVAHAKQLNDETPQTAT